MLRFATCPVDEEPAATLVQGMRDEIAALYEGLNLDGPDMPKAGAGRAEPAGRDVHRRLRRRRRRSAAAASSDCPTRPARSRRCSSPPRLRGRGVARELLAELERRARELGFAVARLDTGPRQPRAQRMYERAGYAAIENFNANPVATFFGEKRLG